MSQPHASSSVTGSVVDLRSLLLLLGRPGARLDVSAPDGAAILGQDRNPRTAPVLATVIEQAKAKDYLIPTGDAFALSVKGREALRSALMAQPAQSGERKRNRDGKSGGRQQGARLLHGAVSSARTAQRLTLVEHLSARRDRQGQPLLKAEHVTAALRLANDFNMGHLQPRVTARWSAEAVGQPQRRGAPGAGVELSDAVASAQARWRTALAAIGGELANLVVDVACLERGLETVEAERHWPSGASRIVLRLALDRLVEHYGMKSRAQGGYGNIVQCGDGDFKPTADARTKR